MTGKTRSTPSDAPAISLEEVSRCVACGLCLPVCPTYAVARNEAESPRGRIALIGALATGALAPTPALIDHLDHCLGCRACERVCPAGVRYGRLINAARHTVHQHALPGTGPMVGLANRLLGSAPRLQRGIGAAGRVARALGAIRLALLLTRWVPRLHTLLRYSQALRPPVATPIHAPAAAPRRGRVALFTGCSSTLFEGDTLRDAIRVLNALGYDVVAPPAGYCCGALALHRGDVSEARRLMQGTMAAFRDRDRDLDAIVVAASGCGATLIEYGQHLPGDNSATKFAASIIDINRFIASHWPEALTLRPLPARVAVHDACSLRNVLRGERAVYELLARIPGLELTPLAENAICCGGAGDYPLRYPEWAARLAAQKTEHVRRAAPDWLVTANIGCALHLAANLREAGVDVPVTHPVSLIARQLPR